MNVCDEASVFWESHVLANIRIFCDGEVNLCDGVKANRVDERVNLCDEVKVNRCDEGNEKKEICWVCYFGWICCCVKEFDHEVICWESLNDWMNVI